MRSKVKSRGVLLTLPPFSKSQKKKNLHCNSLRSSHQGTRKTNAKVMAKEGEESFRSTSSRGSSSRGRVYFRSSVVEFGDKAVGTCGSMRLQLCNSTDSDVVVRVAEPSAPFIVLHKKIRIKANAFVRLPVRFVPMSANFYESLLHVDSGGGREQLVVLLRGRGR